MPTPATPPNYADLAKKQGGYSITSSREDKNAMIPPQLSRLEGSLGIQFVQGPPRDNGEAIASVAPHEPHQIEINDHARFAQGPLQTKAHEITHLLQNQLPGGLQSQILPDDPNHPYSLENLDALRKQGHTFATLPREVGATVVQRWVARPQDRPRLQQWIDDIGKTPLSIMQPTGPNDKTINRNVRPPIPPQEAYMPIKQLVEEAKARDPRKTQPLSFNKGWSKPGPYATKLAPQEEAKFQDWVKKNKVPWQDTPTADYDMRGYWKAQQKGDPNAKQAKNMHFPDTYKTPYHKSFSNESMYATPKAPRWVGDKLMTFDGKLVTDETPKK